MFFYAFPSGTAHLFRQWSISLDQGERRQDSGGPVGVFGRVAIAQLGKAPQALEGQERMFDPGTHRRLALVGGAVRVDQRPPLVDTLVGEVTGVRRQFAEPPAFIIAPIGALAVQPRFVAMQKAGQCVAVLVLVAMAIYAWPGSQTFAADRTETDRSVPS